MRTHQNEDSTLKHNCNVMMSLFPGQLSLRCNRNFHRCTGTAIITTMLIDMLNHPEFSTFDLSHLELVVIGGSPIPLELLRRANSELPNTKIMVSSLGERCKVKLELLPRCLKDHTRLNNYSSACTDYFLEVEPLTMVCFLAPVAQKPIHHNNEILRPIYSR